MERYCLLFVCHFVSYQQYERVIEIYRSTQFMNSCVILYPTSMKE
jgi:hypothetical protein